MNQCATRFGVLILAAAIALVGQVTAGLRPVAAAALTVNSTADTATGNCTAASGVCTLRDALIDANADGPGDTITFDPTVFPTVTPGVILPGTPLPTVSVPVTIDGSGAGVIIDGSGEPANTDGLVVTANSIVLKQLQIVGFTSNGLNVCAARTPTTCPGDLASLSLVDVTITYNAGSALLLGGAHVSNVNVIDSTLSQNGIGGLNACCTGPVNSVTIDGSDLSHNGPSSPFLAGDDAVDFCCTQGSVTGLSITNSNLSNSHRDALDVCCTQGDLTGLTIANTAANSNGGGGIDLCCVSGAVTDISISSTQADGNASDDGFDLCCSGSVSRVTIAGSSFSANTGFNRDGIDLCCSSGSVAGVNVSASTADGNASDGFDACCTSSLSNVSLTSSSFGSSGRTGVNLGLGTGTNIVVGPGNDISGNQSSGAVILGVSNVRIANNNFANNGGDAVAVKGDGAVGNTISQNTMTGDTGLGIDLLSGGGSPGPNRLLGAPIIRTAASTVVSGSACSGCTIEVFAASRPNGLFGEGQQLLGTITAATNGDWTLSLVPSQPGGTVLTATATDVQGDTSEFAQNCELPASPCSPNALDLGQSTIDATPTTVPAGCVQQASVVVTLRNEAGGLYEQPATVTLTSNRGGQDTITRSPTTTSSGTATFQVCSDTPGTSHLSAAANGQALQHTATVTFTQHRYIVFVRGIDSALTDNQLSSIQSDCTSSADTDFHDIKAQLIAIGWSCADFLDFSYTGGSLGNDQSWQPNAYRCEDTGGHLAPFYPNSQSQRLHGMLTTFQSAHPNATFILVGHSQGGLLAFMQLEGEQSGDIAANVAISSVITLDSPLAGASLSGIQILPRLILGALTCRANTRLWLDSDAALEIAGRVSANAEFANEQTVAFANQHGANVITLGNWDDCLYSMGHCLSNSDSKGETFPSNALTQVVRTAQGDGISDGADSMYDLCKASRPITCERGPGVAFGWFHLAVLHIQAGRIADLVGAP